MRKSNGFPTRFPPGTKYVLESRGTEVLRYVELPDGRRYALPKRKAQVCTAGEVSLVPPLPADRGAARQKRRRALA